MAVDPVKNLFTDNEMRGRLLALSVYRPRFPSISSSISDEEYHVHVKRDSNRMDNDEPVPLLATVKLSIKSGRGRKIKSARQLTTLIAYFINVAPTRFWPQVHQLEAMCSIYS